MARNLKKYSDIKGGMDRGPKKQESHVAKTDGDVVKIASRDVIATHSMNTVKNAASLMRENDVRRLPVLDAGTKRLEGLITATDILDFLGGGEKYHIIEKDYGGNFLKAINSPISKIMRDAQYVTKKTRVEDAINTMLTKRSSCIPIVEDEDDLKVSGLITEQDVLPDTAETGVNVGSVMNLKPITTTPGMMLSDASKTMVRNQVRRLPVISEDKVAGVITVFDILGYLEKGDYKGVFAEENLSIRVSEIMEPKVVAVAPDDDLAKVVKLVKRSGYGGFPVTQDDALAGIITTTDILRWIYRGG